MNNASVRDYSVQLLSVLIKYENGFIFEIQLKTILIEISRFWNLINNFFVYAKNFTLQLFDQMLLHCVLNIYV